MPILIGLWKIKMHALVQHYLDNKAQYHRSTWAALVIRRVMYDKNLGGVNDPLTLALIPFMVQDKPFGLILKAAIDGELTNEELIRMIDEMPSGWERAKLMEILELQENKLPK